VDDLLDTGRTLETTVNLLKAEGADKVYAFATHAR
jgi:phosphoribosylpyrophosphate synthetase